MQHPALTDRTPLPVPLYVTGLPAPANALCTIGDAARFIVHLPASHDGVVWSLAGGMVEFAHRDHSALERAGDAIALALDHDHMLNVPIWRALNIVRRLQAKGSPTASVP